jgi:hypothetical protein
VCSNEDLRGDYNNSWRRVTNHLVARDGQPPIDRKQTFHLLDCSQSKPLLTTQLDLARPSNFLSFDLIFYPCHKHIFSFFFMHQALKALPFCKYVVIVVADKE